MADCAQRGTERRRRGRLFKGKKERGKTSFPYPEDVTKKTQKKREGGRRYQARKRLFP